MVRRNGGFIGQDGLDAPDPPTGVSAGSANASISVTFTAPSDVGTSAITGFVAQASSSSGDYSAGSGTGTSSPITISSLSNGTAYTAKVWAVNAYGTSAPSEASSSATPVAPKALIALGLGGGSRVNTVDTVIISTTANSTDFGDLSSTRSGCGTSSGSSSTRGIFAGGSTGSRVNTMDYFTIASAGNATDFGNLLEVNNSTASCSSDTRSTTGGGNISSGATNRIQYVTIASTGNATDFGDLTVARYELGATSSPTRGLWFGGNTASAIVNTIDYVTIASTGNATDFGDRTVSASENPMCSASNTRAVAGGGGVPLPP